MVAGNRAFCIDFSVGSERELVYDAEEPAAAVHLSYGRWDGWAAAGESAVATDSG